MNKVFEEQFRSIFEEEDAEEAEIVKSGDVPSPSKYKEINTENPPKEYIDG